MNITNKQNLLPMMQGSLQHRRTAIGWLFWSRSERNGRLAAFSGSKHRKGNFYQSAKCVGEPQKQGIENIQYIYSKKLTKWINSAIRKVQNAMKDRGLDGTHMHTYENTKVKLKYCSGM